MGVALVRSVLHVLPVVWEGKSGEDERNEFENHVIMVPAPMV